MRGQRVQSGIGPAAAALRQAMGWTQRDLARRAGVSQPWLCRFENGQIGQLTFERVERVLAAMGARLVTTIDAPFLADRRDQRDPAHARVEEYVAARLRRAGWKVATEVEVGGDRSRGWIDILAWHESTGVLLVIEVKTEINDLGSVQRTLSWYRREAWAAARRLGWRPGSVVASVLLLATDANDARVAANRGTFASEFPGRARDLMRVVEGASDAPGDRRIRSGNGRSPLPTAIVVAAAPNRRPPLTGTVCRLRGLHASSPSTSAPPSAGVERG